MGYQGLLCCRPRPFLTIIASSSHYIPQSINLTLHLLPLTMASDKNPSDTDPIPDETMRLSVEIFRAKMESSNQQLLQDRIEEIEVMGLSTEEEKMWEMGSYWPLLGTKGEASWNNEAPLGPVRQDRETRSATRLEDIKTIYHEHIDGIIPSTFSNRGMALDVLGGLEGGMEEVVAEAKEESDEEDFDIPMCYELGHFIKYANSVQDPDFHSSRICPFEPVPSIGIREYAFPERAVMYTLPSPEAQPWEGLKENATRDDHPQDKYGALCGRRLRSQGQVPHRHRLSRET